MTKKVSLEGFKEYYLGHDYNENMFKEDGSLNAEYNSYKKTGIIAQILEDHWDKFYQNNKELVDLYRPNADTEFKKVINCHNKNLGCSVYECPDCHEMIFIGHTCKSRACSSCGYKYKMERVEKILEKVYRVNHRQIVFTIPKELRKYFFYPFSTIDLLFEAVNLTIHSVLNDSFKYSKKMHKIVKYSSREEFTPGFFAFLHTFGRDIKWNPHIHVLIAELKLGNNGTIDKWEYFNYDSLSKRFQKNLLDLLSKKLGSEFDEEMKKSYQNHKNGFYVYAEKKKFKNLKSGIEYVTRYCGRVPISENRIINYDGEKVTFYYNAHEDESYHEITVFAEEFIKMLLRHVVPTQFKIIRYYGFYRKKHKLHDKLFMLIDRIKITIRKTFLKYEFSILKSFNRNPYKCPKCNQKMDFLVEIT